MKATGKLGKVLLLGIFLSFAFNIGMVFAKRKQRPVDVFNAAINEIYRQSRVANVCRKTKKDLSIGLWSIDPGAVPLAKAALEEIHQRIMYYLVRRKVNCLSIIDNSGIGLIAKHLQKSGALARSDGNVLAALAENHQKVDYILSANLTKKGKDISFYLRLNAVSTGKTLAVSRTRQIPKSLANWSENAASKAKLFSVAIKDIAKRFVGNTLEIDHIKIDGLFFQNTEAQPPISKIILDRVVSEIIEARRNIVSGRSIRIENVGDNNDEKKKPKSNITSENSYKLSGHYWVGKGVVELKLIFAKASGESISWTGSILLSSLPKIRMKPKNYASYGSPLPKSNYSFRLRTNKGKYPIFIAGEELQLMFQASRPLWTYCFYVDSAGGVLPIWPLPPSLAAGRTNRIPAREIVKLPNPKVDEFKFRIGSVTLGEELVSCFTTVKNVRHLLPKQLFSSSLAQIPFLTLRKTRDIFSRFKEQKISETMITINVRAR